MYICNCIVKWGTKKNPMKLLKMVDISLAIVYHEDIRCYNLKHITMSYTLVK